jgi:hypothetical protein
MPFTDSRWITAAEAAERLGTTPADVLRLTETNAVEWVVLIKADSLAALEEKE